MMTHQRKKMYAKERYDSVKPSLFLPSFSSKINLQFYVDVDPGT